jgi:prepilin-type processing-associated H-X9-DG protein
MEEEVKGGQKKDKYLDIRCWIYICIVIFIYSTPFFLHTGQVSPELRARRICLNNLLKIGQALNMYAQDYKQYPPCQGVLCFKTLYSQGYLKDLSILTCPSTQNSIQKIDDITEENCSYVFRESLDGKSVKNADLAIVWDKPGNHVKFGNILFADGQVQRCSGVKWLDDNKN